MTDKPQFEIPDADPEQLHSILLRDYKQKIKLTDNLAKDDLSTVLLGLFGEVGSVMATEKKIRREEKAYAGYREDLIEELGDTLWYFNALCERLNYEIRDIFSGAIRGGNYGNILVASDLHYGPFSHIAIVEDNTSIDEFLLKLGQTTALLSTAKRHDKTTIDLLCVFANLYLRIVQATKVPFAEIVRRNVEKVRGRFLEFNLADLPDFDKDFPPDEKLPERFDIEIIQCTEGKSRMRWNGDFIGDPLTDSIMDSDGYRFHDVFHLSYAAILHWSPIFRKLIKRRRKSHPEINEAEDGGRSQVIEEGLSAWIFSRAKNQNFFEGQESLSFDLLKVVREFVQGYEVEKCPLRLWERAIIEGYNVFREVRKNEEGVIIGDRSTRTVKYEPIESTVRKSHIA